MKKIIFFPFIFIAFFNVAHAQANRELCSPEDMNLSRGSATTICDWSRWQPSKDLDAMVTLHGKKNVHAECELTGPDNMLMVIGKKHAKFVVISRPGKHFGFDIDYDNYDDNSDNQNIHFYLDTVRPSINDMLVCSFTPIK